MPSNVIRNYLYDPAKSELWITFVTGRKYVYAAVPQEVFDAFKSAFSRGTFFNVKSATITDIAKFRANALNSLTR